MIGVAQYKTLPASAQLEYPERDAESIYSILISPEGGNFKAENVHKLIGPKATLANLRTGTGNLAAFGGPRKRSRGDLFRRAWIREWRESVSGAVRHRERSCDHHRLSHGHA